MSDLVFALLTICFGATIGYLIYVDKSNFGYILLVASFWAMVGYLVYDAVS